MIRLQATMEFEQGYREGTAKVIRDVEQVLSRHGLINTPEALGDLRSRLVRYCANDCVRDHFPCDAQRWVSS